MVDVYCYWDKDLDFMPPMIKYIYNHNVNISKKYNFNYILISDNNVEKYIEVPKRFYTLASNFKSDIVRFYILHKYGGVWFDSDIIITKDINILYKKFKNTGKCMMLDVEFGSKIGCASLCILPNTSASLESINYIENILKNNNKLSWKQLGPDNISNIYKNYKNDIIVNDKNHVIKGCNFISWKEKPGINRQNWYFDSIEKAKIKADSLINNPDCFYLITWTIYRINDIKGDVIKFIFEDENSVFSHVVRHSINA